MYVKHSVRIGGVAPNFAEDPHYKKMRKKLYTQINNNVERYCNLSPMHSYGLANTSMQYTSDANDMG